MYIDKIIKKEVITLITSVGLLLIIFIGVSFASFFKIDEGENNVVQTGDLAISFCSDLSCDNTYQNMGQLIGTTKQDGSTIPESIFPYPNDGSYSNTTPYIFKVENTGSIEATITIKLNEDTDFLPTGDYSEFKRLTDLYGSHLKIAIRKRVLAPGSEYQMGDVNMDGIVNKNDSDLIRKAVVFAAELTDDQIELADINGDGDANVLDAQAIDQTLTGKDTDLEKTYISSFSDLENSIIYKGDTLEAGESAIYFLWLYLDNKTPNQAQSTYFVGNLDIQGEFLPGNLPFAEASWTQIAENVRAGNTDTYNIGDTKEVDLGDLGTHTVRIANKSTPSECSTDGFSQSACGFVVEFADVIDEHVMNGTNTNVGGWPASNMYSYVNETIYNKLPIELRNAIIDTKVVSGYGKNDVDTANFTSTDKLYLLASNEIWKLSNGRNKANDLSRQLDYYSEKGITTELTTKTEKKCSYTTYRSCIQWLRTADGLGTGFEVISSRKISWYTDEFVYTISPAFRIG